MLSFESEGIKFLTNSLAKIYLSVPFIRQTCQVYLIFSKFVYFECQPNNLNNLFSLPLYKGHVKNSAQLWSFTLYNSGDRFMLHCL